ncbi:MAG: iron-sulfur cluster assembly scaffold protein, partial [Novosphingobium sp.]
ATSLAAWPHDPEMPLQGQSRSQSCGSTLAMSLCRGSDGRITHVGLAAQACAIGQASAAVFAGSAVGQSRSEITAITAAMEAWLFGESDMPEWPGLTALAEARHFPARHGAMMLPWRAALDALP